MKSKKIKYIVTQIRIGIVAISLLFLSVQCNNNQPIQNDAKEVSKYASVKTQESPMNDSIEEDVFSFTANYLDKRNLLEPEKSQLEKPITLAKLKKLYYVKFLEKRNFDTVEIKLYKFGNYHNEDKDRILIKRSTKPNFQVIGDSTRIYNVVMIHRFIKRYNKFSDSLKLKLYEYCIDSYTYENNYIE
ncbi:MAG TPA: hypothetical protein VK835_06135 [Bacteroidia bacterium]|nr:hypothetical protein [Bacteroidia bacterium]